MHTSLWCIFNCYFNMLLKIHGLSKRKFCLDVVAMWGSLHDTQEMLVLSNRVSTYDNV